MIEQIRKIFKANLNVKKNERILVFTDKIAPKEILDPKEKVRRQKLEYIALLAAEIGKGFSKNVVHHEYEATGSHGMEPPEKLWESAFGKKACSELKQTGLLTKLLKKTSSPADIKKSKLIISKNKKQAVNAVIALANYSTSHTRFRDMLTSVCKCRYASMPLFDISMFEGPMNVDYKLLADFTKNITVLLNKAENIRISTPNGTDISFSKKGRKALADTGILTEPGSFGNLPAGEAFLAPLEGTANGKLVLEWAPTRQLRSPITLIVKNGFVAKVSGNEEYVKYLKSRLGEKKENANIAELGIGTNKMAKRPDNILESEKILGTIHIALGDNSSFGGKVTAQFHQDFVFFKPAVELLYKNKKKTFLMEDGKFLWRKSQSS